MKKMNFESVNYFCENIRNEALKNNIDDFVKIIFEKNSEERLKKRIEREIFEKNRQKIGTIYKLINSLLSEIHMTEFLTQERAEKFRILCESVIQNRNILKNFEYFNNSFSKLLLRLSFHEIWGQAFSLHYMFIYFS
jgi:hypothetical protein